MSTLQTLIARLERAEGPDRRLDAEVTAAVLGPPGCGLNPFETPDGFDVETAPDEDGETGYWREAEDVGHLTELPEDAIAFVKESRPKDGAAILARSLAKALSPSGMTFRGYTCALARLIVIEVLQTIEDERAFEAAAIAA